MIREKNNNNPLFPSFTYYNLIIIILLFSFFNILHLSQSQEETLSNWDSFLNDFSNSQQIQNQFQKQQKKVKIEEEEEIEVEFPFQHYESSLGIPTFNLLSQKESSSSSSSSSSQSINSHYSKRDLSAEEIARQSIFDQLSTYKVSEDDELDLALDHIHDTGFGPIIVLFRQKVDGVEIYNLRIKVVLNRSDLTPILITGYVVPSYSPKSFNQLSSIKIAKLAVDSVLSKETDENAYQIEEEESQIKVSGIAEVPEPIRVKIVSYFTGSLTIPAYYLEIPFYFTSSSSSSSSSTTKYLYAFVLSSSDGKLLSRQSLTHGATPYRYRVWADPTYPYQPYDSPQGKLLNPYPRGNISIKYMNSSIVQLVSGPISTKDPWLPGNATSTSGNNVLVFNTRPKGYYGNITIGRMSSNQSFDCAFNLTADARASETQYCAAAAGAFFVINWLHDWFYDVGFDEKAGNAQISNYGRGGRERDPLIAVLEDVGGVNNAYMYTPDDGSSPEMHMFLFTGQNSIRIEGALDYSIIAHEWGHYLSNRLTYLRTSQSRSMGEGWSDFLVLLMIVRKEDGDLEYNSNWTGSYSLGKYALQRENVSYAGFRRLPYSTNMSINPLTFKHIQYNISLPLGFKYSQPVRNGNNAVHNAGEIWALALWECYAALLRDTLGPIPRLSFEEAQNRMKSYLVASLKITPTNPTFLEARDAVLIAAHSADEMDYEAFCHAFAKRGMGYDAVSPLRSSTLFEGIRESYSCGPMLNILSISLEDDIISCDNDDILDRGETGTLAISVQNPSLFSPAGMIDVTCNEPLIQFPNGNRVILRSLGIGDHSINLEVEFSANASLSKIYDVIFTVTLFQWNISEFSYPITLNYDIVPPSSNIDEILENWTISQVNSTKSEWKRIPGSEIGVNGTILFGETPGWVSDIRLESPDMEVGNNSLLITINHAYDFEFLSRSRGYDGGVIEIFRSSSESWEDVMSNSLSFSSLKRIERGKNPLSGRYAYSGKSENFPSLRNDRIDLGKQYQGEKIKMRFRIGTDDHIGRTGWYISMIIIDGIENLPFTGITNQNNSDESCVRVRDVEYFPSTSTEFPYPWMFESTSGSLSLSIIQILVCVPFNLFIVLFFYF